MNSSITLKALSILNSLYLSSTLTSGLLWGGSGWWWRDDLEDSAGFKGLMKLPTFSSRQWQLLSREPLTLSCLVPRCFLRTVGTPDCAHTHAAIMKTFLKAEGETVCAHFCHCFGFCFSVTGYRDPSLWLSLNEFCQSNDALPASRDLWIAISECQFHLDL